MASRLLAVGVKPCALPPVAFDEMNVVKPDVFAWSTSSPCPPLR